MAGIFNASIFNNAIFNTAEVAAAVSGGSGAFYAPTGVSRKRRIDVDREMRDVYEEMMGISPAVAKQAASIIRPFVEKKKKAPIPAVRTVNWQRMEQDAARVAELIALFNQQVEGEAFKRRLIIDTNNEIILMAYTRYFH